MQISSSVLGETAIYVAPKSLERKQRRLIRYPSIVPRTIPPPFPKAIASAVQLRIGASCGSVFGVVASMVEDGGGVMD